VSYSDVLSLLLPLELGGDQAVDLAVEARQLDQVHVSAASLEAEMFPHLSDAFFTRWEKMLGIIPATDARRGERVAEVLYRLRAQGRLDRQYFIDIAATVGFAISLVECRPAMAGSMRCGDEVIGQVARWVWQVTIDGGFAQFARAGLVAAGEPLGWYRDDRHLKAIFEDLKPADSHVMFV